MQCKRKEYENPQQLQEREHEEYLYMELGPWK